MCFLKSNASWICAPVIWLAGMIILILLWGITTPDWIQTHFNQDGHSPVETATVAFFFLQLGFFWLVPLCAQDGNGLSGSRTFRC